MNVHKNLSQVLIMSRCVSAYTYCKKEENSMTFFKKQNISFGTKTSMLFGFADGGLYTCIYARTVEEQVYFSAWNNDETLSSSTFRFSCFVSKTTKLKRALSLISGGSRNF
jgi:hypothetical protein